MDSGEVNSSRPAAIGQAPAWRPDAPPPGEPLLKGNLIDRPPHYASGAIECIEAMEAARGQHAVMEHSILNAMKYLWRAGKKDGMAQDLRKAEWYVRRAAELAEKINAGK